MLKLWTAEIAMIKHSSRWICTTIKLRDRCLLLKTIGTSSSANNTERRMMPLGNSPYGFSSSVNLDLQQSLL
ncbi:MAG: hypothetical protein ABS34_01070 [Opitutaceae bacterium BACL24 MAG-120322-bin51]|nr:MAG: hypothetical protein ABS34_01070 [Opitutaceae bacterium BACL24 MAG-120322-bin51]